MLPGLGAGGTEHLVSLLGNNLASHGWQVTVLAFEDEGKVPYFPHDPRVRIVNLGQPRRGALSFYQASAVLTRLRALRSALKQTSPDVLVSFITRTNVVTLLAAQRLGIPVIVSEQNNPRRQRPGRIWDGLRRLTYRRAARLVTLTAGALACFPASLRSRGRVIPNPAYSPIDPARRKPGSKRIAAAGRLVHQKGFDLLIDAFARVARLHPEWTLVIWGEGPEREALEAQRDRLGLTGRILLPGFSNEPGGWLIDADIFALSSRFEGWGMVVGEAMATGIPVVSFDCQFGPGEMISSGLNGILVPDGDVPALAEALDRLIRDPDLRFELGREAEIAARRFDLGMVLKMWEDAIAGVITPSPAVASGEDEVGRGEVRRAQRA